jgi:hypothetical protein
MFAVAFIFTVAILWVTMPVALIASEVITG